MRSVQTARTREKEKYLSTAYHVVAEKHNSLHITKPLPTRTFKFYDRPYKVIHGERFAAEIVIESKTKRFTDCR